MKRALITGITGQDGSYLAELLLAKGYEVHGIIRRSSSLNTGRVDGIFDRLKLYHGDMLDGSRLARIIAQAAPDEIYNLAAQSHVKVSFEMPDYTCDATGIGVVRLLEAVRDLQSGVRVYQASSSEQFGNAPAPQDETTPFTPRSPYGCAKTLAHHYAVNFREATGAFVCCGILFNHESPRRGETFVTRKITRAVARIAAGRQQKLTLGNLDARRDWGYAPEYVEAMWRMLQQPRPRDYVIATGEAITVRAFAAAAFAQGGLDWRDHVEWDARYQRPTEVDDLRGNAARAAVELGWQPRIQNAALARLMVDADIELLKAPALA